MKLECVEVSITPGFTENCYLLSGQAQDDPVVVVDPGAQLKRILETLDGRTVSAIILTHRHFDHVGALVKLYEETGAAIYIHELEVEGLASSDSTGIRMNKIILDQIPAPVTVSDGATIPVGTEELLVMHTPGHTIGSMCLYSEKDNLLVSGDTLFFEAAGRTDFPTGDVRQMFHSLERLSTLPDTTKVYPGHDQSTTIGYEKTQGYLHTLFEKPAFDSTKR